MLRGESLHLHSLLVLKLDLFPIHFCISICLHSRGLCTAEGYNLYGSLPAMGKLSSGRQQLMPSGIRLMGQLTGECSALQNKSLLLGKQGCPCQRQFNSPSPQRKRMNHMQMNIFPPASHHQRNQIYTIDLAEIQRFYFSNYTYVPVGISLLVSPL